MCLASNSSALMRNIRRHERALEGAIAGICRALMAAERGLGVELPDEGLVRVTFDDSIITDTAAEKRQDMDEVAAGLLALLDTLLSASSFLLLRMGGR